MIRQWDAFVIDAHRGSVTDETYFELYMPDGRFFDRIRNQLFAMKSIDDFYVFDKRLNGSSIGGRRYSLRKGRYDKHRAVYDGSLTDYPGRQFLRWMRIGHRYVALEMHTNDEEIIKAKNVRKVTKLINLLSRLDE